MDLFRKKELGADDNKKSVLKKCLTARDLTLMGIGAIIGAGIFVLTGIVAATHAGPAIILCYIIAGCACGFTALSYAELAAMIGGCGSAYGYAYAGFGELIAWIVGWDLLLEYTLSVAAVAVGWSSYAADFLHTIKIHLPHVLLSSPAKGGWIDLPAVTIIVLLTILLMIGVRSTSRVNGIMVAVKLSVIFLFIVIATFEIDVANWHPFFPFGWTGVIQGASLIFFAYIGFDAVSTAAEEALNPQRDLPIGIIGSLIVCTVLYIIVSALLTGIVHYSSLDLGSPISNALLSLGFKLAAGLISIGAVAGLTTVMLVLFYGLTRILFAMARDGLLPAAIATTHPRFHTPSLIIALCGFLIACLAAFAPLDLLAELVNVGTLFAFIIVCSGVLYLRYQAPEYHRPFKTPGMPYTPILGILSCLYLMINLPGITLLRFVSWMAVGLILYWAYGYKYSNLALKSKKTQN